MLSRLAAEIEYPTAPPFGTRVSAVEDDGADAFHASAVLPHYDDCLGPTDQERLARDFNRGVNSTPTYGVVT